MEVGMKEVGTSGLARITMEGMEGVEGKAVQDGGILDGIVEEEATVGKSALFLFMLLLLL